MFFAGCKSYSDEDRQQLSAEASAYAKRKGYRLEQTESGLLIGIEKPGTGESIQYSSELGLKYVGRLTNGTIVDETSSGKPLKSPLNGLIAGFQEGLLGQQEGAIIHLVIPPYLGYGNDNTGKIPANSVLDFTIEVVTVN